MDNTIVYHGSEGVTELTIDVHRLHEYVGNAIMDIRSHRCDLEDFKILISPLVVKMIELNGWRSDDAFWNTAITGKMTTWFGIEVSDEYPFNDHILIFHKTLGAFHPELVRRVNV